MRKIQRPKARSERNRHRKDRSTGEEQDSQKTKRFGTERVMSAR